ncbi:MAG: hypothetical protein R3324_12785, partial [Halobacteriales archaeon]|nr:hypothetical protein [Halobacteriales archaeon]
MTTIGETTADVSTLLDDIVTAAVALADWSDADANIVNDGATGDWWNNGRVLANANTGTYVLLYHTNGSFRTQGREGESSSYIRYEDGLRIIHSTEWDGAYAYSSGAPGAPSGLTTADNRDGDNTTASPYDDIQENPDASTRAESYPSFTGHPDTGIGMWVRDGASGTTPCSYVGSVGANHIAIAAWGDIENDGSAQASIFAWEHLTNPFWTHGIDYPVAMLSRNS